MSLSEFELISRYFSQPRSPRADVILGVGDDCALLQPPADRQLAISMDTLVEGRHFSPGADAHDLGHKCLAANLSDLAAMGAEPAWLTLALTLPGADADWLGGFAAGFEALATEHAVQLVGGDTTRGPLSITVQAHGFVEPGQALRRDGARPGDLIYVSGTLGDAGLALRVAQGLSVAAEHLPFLRGRLHRPTPRVALGRALRGLASAAIDLSDGLGSDLRHICEASATGATLYLQNLPRSAGVAAYVDETGDWTLPLAAGDDYELCFTVPPEHQVAVEALATTVSCPLTWVGMIEKGAGLRAVLPDGRHTDEIPNGYDHFAND